MNHELARPASFSTADNAPHFIRNFIFLLKKLPRRLLGLNFNLYLVQFNSSPVQSNPVQSNPVQSNPVQSNPVQSNPVQSNPVQSNPVQSNPVQFNSFQPHISASRSSFMHTSYLFGQLNAILINPFCAGNNPRASILIIHHLLDVV
jgi:hypothetical protein